MSTRDSSHFSDPFAHEFPSRVSSATVPAIVAADDISGKVNLGAVNATEAKDVFEAFSLFVRRHIAQGDATDDTVRAYYREIGFWTQWCLRKEIDVSRARRVHVEMYREEMKQQGLRVNTRSHKLSIIRRFYDAAVDAGLREDNPATAVRGGKDQTPGEEKIKSLTAAALTKLLDVIPTDTLTGKRDKAIIVLMCIHGLRRIEIERMNENSILTQDGLTSIEVIGKAKRVRHIYLREDTSRNLANYMESKYAEGLYAGSVDSSNPCFISLSNRSKGQRLSRRSINEIVDQYLSAALLKRSGVSCHALRHTFGTLSIAGGAQVNDLKDAMGHVEVESTELYVKAVARVRDNPANFIDVKS